MNGIPLLNNKFINPVLNKKIIVSPRMENLCQNMLNSKLSVVSAPQGYGKTTLISTAVTTSKNTLSFWYNVTDEDSNCEFFKCHITKLFSINTEDKNYLSAEICRYLWSICINYKKILLVLDNFKKVTISNHIKSFINYIIANSPQNFSILIGKRNSFWNFKDSTSFNNNFTEVTSNELLFSKNEIIKIVHNVYNLNLNLEDENKILKCSGGWIGGVVLACNEFKNAVSFEHIDDIFFNYFSDVVFNDLSEELKFFVSNLSIFTSFSAYDINAIFNIDCSQKLIDECIRYHCYIEIDPFTKKYKFQYMFQESLKRLSKEYISDSDTLELHKMASKYFYDSKNYTYAVEQLIFSKEYEKASDILSMHCMEMMDNNFIRKINDFFYMLPSTTYESNGNMLYIKGRIRRYFNMDEAFKYLNRAKDCFIREGNFKMLITTVTELIFMYSMRSDFTSIQDTINSIPRTSLPKYNSEVAASCKIAKLLKCVLDENLTKGVKIILDLKEVELHSDFKWIKIILSSLIYTKLGRLDYAKETLKKVFNIYEISHSDIKKGSVLAVYNRILFLTRDEKDLKLCIHELYTLGQKYNLPYFSASSLRSEAYVEYHKLNFSKAAELMQKAADLYKEAGNEILYNMCILSECLFLSPEKDCGYLINKALKAYKNLSSIKTNDNHMEIYSSELGAIYRDAGCLDNAKKYLSSSLKTSLNKNNILSAASTYLHLSKLYYIIGDEEHGKDCLMEGFFTASNNSFKTFPDVHFETLVECCIRGIKYNICRNYSERILNEFFGKDGLQYILQYVDNISEDTIQYFSSYFVKSFSEEYKSDLSHTVYVQLFGKFQLSVDGIIINNSEWKTKKVSGILKYLILNADKVIPRERLIEIFWAKKGTYSSDSNSASLRVALSSIRKVFKKYGVSFYGDNEFLEETKSTLMIKRNINLKIDIDDFNYYYSFYTKIACNFSDVDKNIKTLEKIVNFYKGNLLDGDIYEDWIDIYTEDLKNKFFSSAFELSKLYIIKKKFDSACQLLLRILELDPYNEDACFALVKLYSKIGKRSMGISLYNKFEKNYIKNLEMKPVKSLKELINI